MKDISNHLIRRILVGVGLTIAIVVVLLYGYDIVFDESVHILLRMVAAIPLISVAIVALVIAGIMLFVLLKVLFVFVLSCIEYVVDGKWSFKDNMDAM